MRWLMPSPVAPAGSRSGPWCASRSADRSSATPPRAYSSRLRPKGRGSGPPGRQAANAGHGAGRRQVLVVERTYPRTGLPFGEERSRDGLGNRVDIDARRTACAQCRIHPSVRWVRQSRPCLRREAICSARPHDRCCPMSVNSPFKPERRLTMLRTALRWYTALSPSAALSVRISMILLSSMLATSFSYLGFLLLMS